MLKEVIIHFFFSFLVSFSFSQSLQIKESFDSYYLTLPYANIINNIPQFPIKLNPGDLGEGLSYFLESNIRLFEATGDKAYLIKFINNTIKTLEQRGNYDCYEASLINQSFPNGGCNQMNEGKPYTPISWNPQTQLSWSHNTYYNGLILWTMANFVYLIRKEVKYNINNDVIDPLGKFQCDKIGNNNFQSFCSSIYEDFALWLRNKIKESMDYFVENFWLNDNKGFSRIQKNYWYLAGTDLVMVINKQAPFGAALFYLGATDPTIAQAANAAMNTSAKQPTWHKCIMAVATEPDVTLNMKFINQKRNSLQQLIKEKNSKDLLKYKYA